MFLNLLMAPAVGPWAGDVSQERQVWDGLRSRRRSFNTRYQQTERKGSTPALLGKGTRDLGPVSPDKEHKVSEQDSSRGPMLKPTPTSGPGEEEHGPVGGM